MKNVSTFRYGPSISMTSGNLLVVCGGFRATKYVYKDCVYWQRASLRLRRNTRWKSIYTIGYPTVPAPLKHGLCLPILLFIDPTKTLYVHQKFLGLIKTIEQGEIFSHRLDAATSIQLDCSCLFVCFDCLFVCLYIWGLTKDIYQGEIFSHRLDAATSIQLDCSFWRN